jgi:hypothetical protein
MASAEEIQKPDTQSNFVHGQVNLAAGKPVDIPANDSKELAGENQISLFDAVKAGNLDAVKKITERAFYLEQWTPISAALSVYYGHLNILEYMISLGWYPKKNGYLAIWAASRGHLEIVKYLVSLGCNPKLQHNDALMVSSYGGHFNVVKYLVEIGCNPKDYESTALIYAATGGNTEIVQYFISLGCSVDSKNSEALRLSAAHGHLSTVKCLVEAGCNPTLHNNQALKASVVHSQRSTRPLANANMTIARLSELQFKTMDIIESSIEQDSHTKISKYLIEQGCINFIVEKGQLCYADPKVLGSDVIKYCFDNSVVFDHIIHEMYVNEDVLKPIILLSPFYRSVCKPENLKGFTLSTAEKIFELDDKILTYVIHTILSFEVNPKSYCGSAFMQISNNVKREISAGNLSIRGNLVKILIDNLKSTMQKHEVCKRGYFDGEFFSRFFFIKKEKPVEPRFDELQSHLSGKPNDVKSPTPPKENPQTDFLPRKSSRKRSHDQIIQTETPKNSTSQVQVVQHADPMKSMESPQPLKKVLSENFISYQKDCSQRELHLIKTLNNPTLSDDQILSIVKSYHQVCAEQDAEFLASCRS